MAYIFKRSVRKIKQLNRWGVLSLIVFLVCLGTIGYFGRMFLEKGRFEKVLEEKNKELVEIKSQLSKEKDDDEYRKYQAAKVVIAQSGRMNRNENISYLVDLLDELTALDATDNSILLENFQINEKSINLRGSVYSIKTVYKEGGVIDKFESFDFINKISIPSYRINEETQEINFVLDATIQEYEGTL